MVTTSPATIRYRLLGQGDVLREGDEYQDRFDDEWYPTRCVGVAVGVPNRTTMEYRRRVPEITGVNSPVQSDFNGPRSIRG